MCGKLNTSFNIPCTCNTNQVAEKQFVSAFNSKIDLIYEIVQTFSSFIFCVGGV